MKKLTLIVSALALLIGFSQCKKEEITPNNNGQGVRITLTAGYGQDGQKTGFNDGSFVWTNGATEYIYVGGANHMGCIGVLSGTGNGTVNMTFEGNVTPNVGEELHFFYLGKGRDGSAVSTLDFSSQDGTQANVTNYHIAIGSATYDGTSNSLSATLNMAMAIAYFDLNGFNNDSKAAETVYLSGNDVYSTATINYKEGKIEKDAKGNINLGTSGSKYVALIPSVNTETMLRFESDSKIGGMTFLRGIQAGKFYSSDNHSALAVTANSCLFSVAANKKVKFSRGNLQYQASTDTWRFAEHQYDFVGDATKGNVYVDEVKSNNANIADDYTGWIDLFGCGTGNNPTMHTTIGTDYSPYVDWGTSASGNIGSGWRAMSSGIDSEWEYIYKTRSTTTNNLPTGTGSNTAARYMMAKIANTYKGLVLFPDTYIHPDVTIGGAIVYNAKSDFTATISSIDDWSKMEAAGAVFLPAAGQRSNTTVNNTLQNGYYWGGDAANSFIFYKSDVFCSYTGKYIGCSVRLVKDVE